MVVGAAGELPKPPPKPIVFMEGAFTYVLLTNLRSFYYEDMDDTELAEAVREKDSISPCFTHLTRVALA